MLRTGYANPLPMYQNDMLRVLSRGGFTALLASSEDVADRAPTVIPSL